MTLVMAIAFAAAPKAAKVVVVKEQTVVKPEKPILEVAKEKVANAVAAAKKKTFEVATAVKGKAAKAADTTG